MLNAVPAFAMPLGTTRMAHDPASMPAGASLQEYFQTLSAALGPMQWWPAKTPFEVIVGAILTQSTAWVNVEQALANLRRERLLTPAGLERISVPGATGYFDTNYKGKGEYGLGALKEKDLVFIHVEAPDEAGHMGNVEEKIKAIENFDEKVVGTVLDGLRGRRDWRLLLLPDHPTPCALKTHVPDPVPFVLYGADQNASTDFGFNESDAKRSGVVVKKAFRLIESLIGGTTPWIEISP